MAGLFYEKDSIAIWAVMGDVIARACNFGDEEAKDENPPEMLRGVRQGGPKPPLRRSPGRGPRGAPRACRAR